MPAEDAEREARLANEILVDAYTESERALSWYYYLDEMLSFPFKATCITEIAASPLRTTQEVQVIAMATEDDCMNDMQVRVEHGSSTLVVPLRQLRSHSRSRITKQAVQDWHYWIFRGYEF